MRENSNGYTRNGRVLYEPTKGYEPDYTNLWVEDGAGGLVYQSLNPDGAFEDLLAVFTLAADRVLATKPQTANIYDANNVLVAFVKVRCGDMESRIWDSVEANWQRVGKFTEVQS